MVNLRFSNRKEVPLAEAPRYSTKGFGGRNGRSNRRYTYAVTEIILVPLPSGEIYVALYGVRVRRDGQSFGWSHPIPGRYRDLEPVS